MAATNRTRALAMMRLLRATRGNMMEGLLGRALKGNTTFPIVSDRFASHSSWAMGGQRAILHQTLLLRRARALVIVRLLHKATGGDIMQWRLVDVIVKRRADLDVLAYAVEQGWIEVAPETHSVRLTAEGWRAVR